MFFVSCQLREDIKTRVVFVPEPDHIILAGISKCLNHILQVHHFAILKGMN